MGNKDDDDDDDDDMFNHKAYHSREYCLETQIIYTLSNKSSRNAEL
jgi:hypothetical protein